MALNRLYRESRPGLVVGGQQRRFIEAMNISRRFGKVHALHGVTLEASKGEIVALLGPNGAGKTTLLRIMMGLVDADEGQVRLLGRPPRDHRDRRFPFGYVPSGDRTFYLRVSGVENLMFFARLFGFPKREASTRARQTLREVGLSGAARRPVRTYSHGMQKRLSIARALLPRPPILFADEPTHDLDPRAAHDVRELVTEIAQQGTAIVWTTQRLDEIRGFAHRAIVLDRGSMRFTGPVADLIAHATNHRFLVQLAHEGLAEHDLQRRARRALEPLAALDHVPEPGAWYILTLDPAETLGEAIARLSAAGLHVLTCTQERSEIERAFLALTDGRS